MSLRMPVSIAALLVSFAGACSSYDREIDATRGGTLSSHDREFASKASSAGQWEIETSQLVLSEKPASKYHDFAERMIEDHGAANRRLSDLLGACDCEVASGLDASQRGSLDELRALKEPEFDDRYRALQIKAHDEAIRLFEKASRECDDADLRRFAADTLPTIRDHRAHLDRL